jgi:hypothetical protein
MMAEMVERLRSSVSAMAAREIPVLDWRSRSKTAALFFCGTKFSGELEGLVKKVAGVASRKAIDAPNPTVGKKVCQQILQSRAVLGPRVS